MIDRREPSRAWHRGQSTWKAHARATAAGVVVMALAAYTVVVGRPKLQMIDEMQRQIADLDAQRTVAGAAAKNPSRQPLRDEPGGSAKQLDAGQVVPEISVLGRRAGLKITAVRQSGESSSPGSRRIRVLAQGAFPALVAFLDGVAAALPQGRVEELTLRHLSTATETAGDIEVDSILYLPIAASARGQPGRDEVGS